MGRGPHPARRPLALLPAELSLAWHVAAAGVNVGAGFVMREAARALVQVVPGFGQAVSASVAYAGTYAVGTAATSYFLRGQTDDLEAQFQEAFEEGRKAAPDDLTAHPNPESA